MSRRIAFASLILLWFCTLPALFHEQNSIAKPSQGTQYANAKNVRLTGHVLAKVEHVTGYTTNALGGQSYDVFIFGIDSGEKQLTRQTSLVPVKVVYEFYRNEPKLPEAFFDFGSLYELSVRRDASCDESVKSLSYETDVVPGKPPSSRNILKALKGAPDAALKPDLILNCYLLRPGNYATALVKKSVLIPKVALKSRLTSYSEKFVLVHKVSKQVPAT
jgi:hypothetical protein